MIKSILKDSDWYCTKCKWNGTYDESYPVMFYGIDWQLCPSCKAIAIPACGSTIEIKEKWDERRFPTI